MNSVLQSLQNTNSTNKLIAEIHNKLFDLNHLNRDSKFMAANNNFNDIYNKIQKTAKQAAKSFNRISFNQIPMSLAKRASIQQNIE